MVVTSAVIYFIRKLRKRCQSIESILWGIVTVQAPYWSAWTTESSNHQGVQWISTHLQVAIDSHRVGDGAQSLILCGQNSWLCTVLMIALFISLSQTDRIFVIFLEWETFCMLFPMLRDPALYNLLNFRFQTFFFLTRSLSIPQPVLHVLLRDTFLYKYMQEALFHGQSCMSN